MVRMDRDYLAELGTSRADLHMPNRGLPRRAGLLGAFYVYVLWADLPTGPVPFYVGKGTRSRYSAHWRRDDLKADTWCSRVIRKLRWSGTSILVSFTARGLSEADAHRIEMDTIARLGRRQHRTGPLVNHTDGGEGVSGIQRTAPNRRPTYADGVRYETAVEAAAAHNIAIAALLARIRRGWPGFYYEDQGQHPCRMGRRTGADNHRTRPVIADGRRYQTVTAAARHLDCHPPAILRRIRAGWDGYYYEDEGQRTATRPRRRPYRRG